MSRLTQSPFHAPSPFHFPMAPLSPPETTAESVPPSFKQTKLFEADVESENARASQETPAARFRRVSSLAYNGPGSQERPQVRSQHKAFIVVVPPQSLLQEPGLFGSTLSSGPTHRLSQGILMPLFPTMYAQLAAIAKEFNFPSTVGVCLYYHYNNNGTTASPRIADETWPMFWNVAFDPSAPLKTPPIHGKVEFDIDTQRARWFSSWHSRSHRSMQLDVTSLLPSLDAGDHMRNASMTTTYNSPEEPSNLQSVNGSSIQRVPHLPRQLSLVDRVASSRQVPRPSQLQAVASTNQDLSPIKQAEEPVSAALQSKVQSWRASATLRPTGLTVINGQTSLEPANLPNSINLELESESTFPSGEDEEIKLEDYQWSVSSYGPPDYDLNSIASGTRLPSVHLAGRAAGSVLLTPSTRTSFGPSDYTLSPISIGQGSRILTPDIAWRMYEDVPLTPSDATSWGPASVDMEWEGVSVMSRPRSLDLGDRMGFSRPVTPSTATSWGPLSWPSSPIEFSRPPSVGLEYRMDFSRPVTPTTATSWGPASWPNSPNSSEISRPASVGLADRMEFSPPGTPAYRGREFWSYALAEADVDEISLENLPVWPHRWQEAQVTYPEFDIYPSLEALPKRERNETLLVSESSANDSSALDVLLPAAYPNLEIYPNVYPFNLKTIYRFSTAQFIRSNAPLSNALEHVMPKYLPKFYASSQYPDFDMYPYRIHIVNVPRNCTPRAEQFTISREYLPQLYACSQYPDFNLYPFHIPIDTFPGSVVVAEERTALATYLTRLYPAIELYPAQYPVFEIYPVSAIDKIRRLKTTHAELHEIVIASGIRRKIGRKSHHELHEEVLTRTRKLQELHASLFPDAQPVIDRAAPPLHRVRRPDSPPEDRQLPAMPPPHGLPPNPGFYRRSMFMAEDSSNNLVSSPSLHRSASSASAIRPSNALRRTPGLGSVEERVMLLARSNSSPPSQGDARRILARRRDSVVLQRAKAYSNNLSSDGGALTLSRFPSPPRNPAPVTSLPTPPSI